MLKQSSSPTRTEYRVESLSDALKHFMHDASACPKCGHIAVRNGAWLKYLNYSESLGCF